MGVDPNMFYDGHKEDQEPKISIRNNAVVFLVLLILGVAIGWCTGGVSF